MAKFLMYCYFFVMALSTLGPLSAFSQSSPHLGLSTTRCRSSTVPTSRTLPRSLTIVQSANVLPYTYLSLSAALLYRATVASTLTSSNVPPVDTAVLVTMAALSAFNLAPMDNARLASAKRADQKYPPASSGLAKQRRQAAKTWRSTVNIKIAGQLLGLVRMASAKSGFGVMRGAAIVMGANMAFFISGGGQAKHDSDGAPAPMPAQLAMTVLTIDTVLTTAALLAASAPIESTRRAICGGVFAAGTLMGALEGVATLVSSKK
jgi:hypothetical protein